MIRYLYCCLSVLLVFIALGACEAQDRDVPAGDTKAENYVINDFTMYKIPEVPKPEKGVPFIDPTFHTEITRITDSARELPGRKGAYASTGYPKHDIENADGTRLVIQSFSGSTWHIWDARPPYGKVLDIPSSLIGWGRPLDMRWDSRDPDVLYFQMKGKFYKFNVESGKHTVLHDFRKDFPPREGEEYPRCGQTFKEEGTPSADSRYWAFSIYCKDPSHNPRWYDAAIVVYDKDYYEKDRGKIISRLTPDNPHWRGTQGFVSMSPSGKYVWVGDHHAVYTRDFSEFHAFPFCCHADMALSDEGREVIFGFMQKPGTHENWAIMADLETKKITWLVPIGKPRYHLCGNNYDTPGWGVVSTYAPNGPAQHWGDHEVFMVELTRRKEPPPRVWRIAHTHTVRKGYADDPFAKINRRGTKIWFGSGWGKSYKDGPYDVYQVDLPKNWHEKLRIKVAE
ncbi:MAG: hypothetical protein P8Y75_03265 [Nitrospirota bacterium]|jgi:hypothetical protein